MAANEPPGLSKKRKTLDGNPVVLQVTDPVVDAGSQLFRAIYKDDPRLYESLLCNLLRSNVVDQDTLVDLGLCDWSESVAPSVIEPRLFKPRTKPKPTVPYRNVENIVTTPGDRAVAYAVIRFWYGDLTIGINPEKGMGTTFQDIFDFYQNTERAWYKERHNKYTERLMYCLLIEWVHHLYDDFDLTKFGTNRDQVWSILCPDLSRQDTIYKLNAEQCLDLRSMFAAHLKLQQERIPYEDHLVFVRYWWDDFADFATNMLEQIKERMNNLAKDLEKVPYKDLKDRERELLKLVQDSSA
jgi:hypothetical protein